MFGINGGELVVLLVVAALVIGPERLPAYAEQLGTWVRRARRFAQDAKARVDEELGEEARDIDWASLDPRRYDPRRIVREALLEDVVPARPVTVPATTRPTAGRVSGGLAAGATSTAVGGEPSWRAPFDDEAT